MTDEGTQVQPDVADIAAGESTLSFRPRGTYAGHRAFGSGDGAVLVEPGLVHQLRSAAELATHEQRCTGGLLFGRRWADDQGAYLVVSGFVEAGPDASSGGDFLLSPAELGLLREDAAAMYSGSYEVGWWRTLGGLGEFGPRDLAAQAELAGPANAGREGAGHEGVGLLVYGSGIHWGTAYLGPDGRAPDSAGTLVVVPAPDAEAPAGPEPAAGPEPPAGPEPALEPDPVTDLAAVPETEPAPGPEVVDFAAGESMLEEAPLLEEDRPAADTVPPAAAAPEGAVPQAGAPGRARRRVRPAGQARRRARPAGQARQRMSTRVLVPTRVRGRARAGRPVDAIYEDADYPYEGPDAGEAPGLQTDEQLVAIALALTFVAAAVIVGYLAHSVVVAVIIAAVGLLATAATVWMSRYH